MADISKIKLPSGSTYDIVDKKSGYKVVSISRKVDSGVNIADITIGDTTTQLYAPQGGGAGTVTSVGVSNATNGGLSVSGSPVTSSGTITIGHSNVLSSAQTTQAVYPIKIDKNGHISAYGSAVTIPSTASDVGAVPTSRTVNGKALSSNISLTASDVGALSTETDPIFAASAAAGITSTDISNWNNKLSGSSVKTNSYMIIGDWKIQWGSVSFNTSGASGSGSFTAPYYSDKNITFSPAFAAIPYMYATIQGAWTGSRSVLCHNTSTTGSTIRMLSSHKNSSDVTIRWLAIGRNS